MTWATDRLEALKHRTADLPLVVRTLELGAVDDWGAGWAKKRWLPSDNFLNADGSLFGGYLAALADQMAAFAAMSVVPDGFAFRTIHLSVQFFRLCFAHPLAIEGRVVSQSRSLIAVEAYFRKDGEDALLAQANAQQMLVPFS